MADSEVIGAIHGGKFGPEDFLSHPSGVTLRPAARRRLLLASAVVLTFGAALVGVARRELGTVDASLAEDAVQEVYAAMASGALASAALALDLGSGLPWLKRLVREQAWDQRERRSRATPRPVGTRHRWRW